MLLQIRVFWAVTQFGWVCGYWSVEESNSLHLQCRTVQQQSLIFDCLALNMNALVSIETSGTVYLSTRRNASEDVIHICECCRSHCCVVDGTTTLEWIPHLSKYNKVIFLAQEMSKDSRKVGVAIYKRTLLKNNWVGTSSDCRDHDVTWALYMCFNSWISLWRAE